MEWKTIADALFGIDHDITARGDLLVGTASFDGQSLAVVGTTGHAAIGMELALAQAAAIIDTIRDWPGRTILLLVDTQGQQLRRRDELLGLHRAMAHLGQCIDHARRQGHRVLALVYDQALSGGFITSGLMANACDALADAEIRVMRIPAMARVTKIPAAALEALSHTNPVFAPGAANYYAMGGIQALWQGDWQQSLRDALAVNQPEDRRVELGLERGGRLMAARVVQMVMEAPR